MYVASADGRLWTDGIAPIGHAMNVGLPDIVVISGAEVGSEAE